MLADTLTGSSRTVQTFIDTRDTLENIHFLFLSISDTSDLKNGQVTQTGTVFVRENRPPLIRSSATTVNKALQESFREMLTSDLFDCI